MCLFEAKRKQTSLEIVVISTIAEGIEVCIVGSRTTVVISGDKVTPGVIGIGDQLIAVLIVYGHNVALQILLKPVDIKNFGGISLVAILHTNRRTLGIVEIQHKMLAPLLGHDLIAVEDIPVCLTVDRLAGADALIVVGEGQRVPVSFCL